jgi:hypothetical protein
MCTRNFDPLKDWSEDDRQIVLYYLKGKRSGASAANMKRKKK